MDIISLILGLLGFLLSVANAIYFFYIRRCKLIIRFSRICVSNYINNKSILKVQYSIENRSQLPISVTRIQVVIAETQKVDCLELPIVIEEIERTGKGEVFDRDTIKSETVPFNLQSLAAKSGYIAFEVPRDIVLNKEKRLTFQICTNRGNSFQQTAELDVLH